ncbi:hypothetical protein [Sphingobium indicum]|uniref:hypothetical protein n=1 Tax=Sphingobium indicum TaxID=332055 RepID=UPI0011DF9065|nr:hypothetical protein [Sphingobium indicum]
MNQLEQSGYIPAPVIKRGSLTSLSIYEITDYELDILESGGPSSLYLNFAIFLISIGISFLITLMTTDISNTKIYNFFLISTILGLIIGLLLLTIWKKTYTSTAKLCIKIRSRIISDE